MASSSIDGKIQIEHVDGQSPHLEAGTFKQQRVMEPPELVKGLSQEERTSLEKHLVRKIDIRLLPAVVIMYIMNYLDRNNIAAARIAGPGGKGLQDELNLTDTQYQLAVSILFVGYILMQGRYTC